MAENTGVPAVRNNDELGREIHEVAKLFPPMRGADFQGLVADIKKNGLREAILIDAEGRIIDGRNRHRACFQAGVEPRFEIWQGQQPLTGLALSLNLKRRHLGESQRAMVAARLTRLLVAERKGNWSRRREDLPSAEIKSAREEAAKQVNISLRLADEAGLVLKKGCEELIAEVDSGYMAVTPAAVLTRLPGAEQREVLAAGPAAVAAKVRELRGLRNQERAPGEFGVLPEGTHSPKTVSAQAIIVFPTLAPDGLAVAVSALKARGFRQLHQAQ